MGADGFIGSHLSGAIGGAIENIGGAIEDLLTDRQIENKEQSFY